MTLLSPTTHSTFAARATLALFTAGLLALVLAIGGGYYLLNNPTLVLWGVVASGVCLALSLAVYLLAKAPLFVTATDLENGKVLAGITLALGILPVLPYLYFFQSWDWDGSQHGPWWNSGGGGILLFCWGTLFFVMPLITAVFAVTRHRTSNDRRYLIFGAWLVASQLILGLINFGPVVSLID